MHSNLTRFFSLRYLIPVSFLLTLAAGEISTAETNPSNTRLLHGDNPYLISYAIHKIAFNGSRQMDLVVTSACDTNPQVRKSAYFAIGLSPLSNHLKMFQEGLADSVPQVRRYALMGLANIENGKHLDLAAKNYRDPHPCVREMLAMAAGQYRCKTLTGHMAGLLTDPSPRVRRAAATAIGSIGDRRGLKYLQKLMCKLEKQPEPEKSKRLNQRTQALLKISRNFPFGFSYFQEIIAKFAERTGVEVILFEELVYSLNINAEGPENLNNLKLSIWDLDGETTLNRIVNTVAGYWYIDCGTVYIAPGNYRYVDTPLKLETAYAMARLGDSSRIDVIKSFSGHKIYGRRAKMMLKNLK